MISFLTSYFPFVSSSTYLVSVFPPSPNVLEMVILFLLAVQPIFRLQRCCLNTVVVKFLSDNEHPLKQK